MIYNILPLFLGVVQDARGYSDQQLGFLTSAYFIGFAIITFSAFFWIRKVNWRYTSLVMGLLTVGGLAATMFSETYLMFVICLICIGTSASALYAIGMTMLGDTLKAARNFGFKIGAEAALGALLMIVVPPLVLERWGFSGLMVTITVTALILTLAAFWLPTKGVKGATDPGEQPPEVHLSDIRSQLPIWLCLLGIFVYFGGISALWAFLERLGDDAGYSSEAIGVALSLSLVGAMVGSFIAAGIGDRFRLMPPLSVATAIFLTAVGILAMTQGLTLYAFGSFLFALAFGFALPFMVTVVSAFDVSGRYIVLTAPALALGGIVGPGIAGTLTSGGGYLGLILFSSVSVLVSLVLFLLAMQRAGQPTPTIPADLAGI